MIEAFSSDSASDDDHVPRRRSSESSFAFMEKLISCRLELGFLFRLDDEGKPIVKVNGGTAFTLHGGVWTNMGFSNELICYRSPYEFDWDDYHLDRYTYNCYVANAALLQVMPIPSHPDELDGEYSIVALGLSSCFDSDCWKLIAVLKSKLEGKTFGDDEFAKVGSFDPETRAWATDPARFSDEFNYYFESYSDLFYLTSSPVYHGEALYWVHGWNAKGPEIASSARYPWNVEVPVPGQECKLRPLSLLKLCLKTSLFRVIHMPVIDKRNVGLLCKSEGRVTYCHLCPDAGLSIWVLSDDDTASSSVWRQTHYIHPNLIDLRHNDELRFELLGSCCYTGSQGYEDEEDMECKICNQDFISVLAFNKELHTIVFKINGCEDDVVCFDFEEKVVVSNYKLRDYIPERRLVASSLEHHPAIPLGEVARMWIQKKRAPYENEMNSWLHRFGLIDSPGFAENKGLDLMRKRKWVSESEESSERSEEYAEGSEESAEGSEGSETRSFSGVMFMGIPEGPPGWF